MPRHISPIRGGSGWIYLIVVPLMMIWVGCSESDNDDEDAGEDPVRVEVSPVERRSIAKVLSYSGDIAGEVEVRVFSIIPDRIVSLRVEEGQQISRGDVVAVIRAEALGQGVRQAMGALGSARAQVEGLRDTLTRQRRLLASGVVTQAQVDATNFQLRAAESQAAQLDATVGSARTRRSDAQIRAPISGTVGQVFVEAGDMAAPQIPICTVVQMDRVEITIQVPERDLGMVRAGMDAEIRVASVPGKVYRAPISRVSPVVDRLSRTARVRLMLENPDHRLRPGALADVDIEVARNDGALVVNQYSLVLDDRPSRQGETAAAYRAYVLDGNVARERQIRVGMYDGDFVEVTEGLNEGDPLITQGQHLLREGRRVQVGRPGGTGDGGPEAVADASAAPATPPPAPAPPSPAPTEDQE